jgi:hypothetical protein
MPLGSAFNCCNQGLGRTSMSCQQRWYERVSAAPCRATLLLKRHALTPFAVPAGLGATVRCVLLMRAQALALQVGIPCRCHASHPGTRSSVPPAAFSCNTYRQHGNCVLCI